MPAKKEQGTFRNPRLLKRGDIVRVQPTNGLPEMTEVVRDVFMVVRLANGADVQVDVNENVEVFEEKFTEDLTSQIEAMQSGD